MAISLKMKQVHCSKGKLLHLNRKLTTFPFKSKQKRKINSPMTFKRTVLCGKWQSGS